jgi:hypothetical protein
MAAAHNPHRRPPVIEQAVVRALKTHAHLGAMTAQHIGRVAQGVDRSSVLPAIQRLRRKGIIRSVGHIVVSNRRPSSGHPERLYALTAQLPSGWRIHNPDGPKCDRSYLVRAEENE